MRIFALLLTCLALGFAGCHKATVPAPEVVFAAVQKNLQALESKDPDVFMATIHPKAPAFDSTRDIVSEMFKNVNLKYTLSNLQVVSATPEEVKVSFTQKTENLDPKSDFPSSIVEGIHTLRPDQGKWKIFRTEQIKVTDLNGKPIMVGGEAPATSEPTKAAPAPAPPAAVATPPPAAAPATPAP